VGRGAHDYVPTTSAQLFTFVLAPAASAGAFSFSANLCWYGHQLAVLYALLLDFHGAASDRS